MEENIPPPVEPYTIETGMSVIIDFVQRWFDLTPGLAAIIVHVMAFTLVLALAVFFKLVINLTLVRLIKRVSNYFELEWVQAAINFKALSRLAHFVPAVTIQVLGPFALVGQPRAIHWMEVFVGIYILLIMLGVAVALLDTLEYMANRRPKWRDLPIKGFSQAIKLLLYLFTGVLILSVLFGQSPIYFFSGLGALTAILMLIFKDSILGLVAGVQLSVNQMVRVGDWIEMPKQNVDGDVVDVSLTTVKVRNWDNTISTIPAYSLISESVKNWRGMSESGGRRIKRSINIDTQTIGFATEEMLARWQKISLLKPYLEARLKEIADDNAARGEDLGVLGNGRRLTNVGTFRAYCYAYLRAHKEIHKGMTLLVRQLQPTQYGLPLELYVFTSDVRWAMHEDIQSDIFDHLLAILPQFDLSVYQSPSGHDIKDTFSSLGALEISKREH